MSTGVIVVGPHGPIVVQPAVRAAPPEPPDPPEPMLPIEPVVLVPDYLPDGLAGLLDDIVAALQARIITILPLSHGLGVDVNEARRAFRTFLLSAAFGLHRQKLYGGDGEPGIAASLKARELEDVLGDVATLRESTATTPPIDRDTMALALRREPARYWATHGQNPEEPDAGSLRDLPGYTGPALSNDQLAGLAALSRFMNDLAERALRLDALEAEANAGLHRYADALTAYGLLLASGSVRAEHQRFVALRAGFARLAEGDRLYRSSRTPSSKMRSSITAQYDAAVAVVTGRGIGTAHPQRQQIVDYATARKQMLDAGLNALGFRDSYVPSLRPEALEGPLRTRLARAVDARDRFMALRQRGNELDDRAAELALESDVAAINVELAGERRLLAGQQTTVAETRVTQLEDQIDGLVADTVLAMQTSVLKAGAATLTGGPPAAGFVFFDGFASALIGHRARSNQLGDQLQLARLEVAIAEREERIADLEEQIAQTRAAFLRGRIETLGDRLLDADLFYELANLYEAMAERNLEMAIRWAFLYERAVAFRRLIPNLRLVALDYRDSGTGIIAAPERLQDIVDAIAEAELPQGEYQLLNENPISLRTRYPIAFNRFLQTGAMDFTISLYDLEKLRPGVYHRRLERVEVEVTGLIPRTGFGGTIRHRGAFAIRDKATTLGPPPIERLLPDGADIVDAVRSGSGMVQGVPVEGVLFFVLDDDEDIQQLSAEPPPADTNPEARAFAIFEGRGETGNWRLQITGLDLRLISDVLIKFTAYFPETDAALEAHVGELVERYEQEVTADALDQVALISLRDDLPDALDALRAGPATFELTDEDLPANVTDERVKAVVAQFVDADGEAIAGLTIEMSRPGTPLTVTRTSGDDGLTEPPDVPVEVVAPADRVPVVGEWRLRLVDPTDVDRIDDVRLFIVYSFRPAE